MVPAKRSIAAIATGDAAQASGSVRLRNVFEVRVSSVVSPVTPPDETRGSAVGAFQEGAPDRLRQGRIVEFDAQVGLLRSLARSAPGGTDLGRSGQNPEVRGALGLLAVVGDKAHPHAHG